MHLHTRVTTFSPLPTPAEMSECGMKRGIPGGLGSA